MIGGVEEDSTPCVYNYVSTMLITYRQQIKNNNDSEFYSELLQHRSDDSNIRTVCGLCDVPGVNCPIIKIQEWTKDKFEDIMIFDAHEWGEFVSWLQKFCDDDDARRRRATTTRDDDARR